MSPFASSSIRARLIDAPRERVFRAFADPARIAPVVEKANEQNLDRLAAEVRGVV